MDDRAALAICLQKIEEKIDWRPSKEWTDYDFRLLKKEIHSCSGISISTHTLKRLFGKIKYKSNYSPQHATKDALAQFIGYDSWEEYLRKSDVDFEPIGEIKKKSGSKTRSLRFNSGRSHLVPTLSIFVGLIVITTVIIIILSFRIPESSFNVENPEGTIPHTVTFKYDISKIRSDHIYIDFDFSHPELGSDYHLRSKQENILINTYQIPGVYHPRLVVNNRVVDSGQVVAKSEGWVSFYHGMGIKQEFWMDKMVRSPEHYDFMSLTRKDLARYDFDTTGIYFTTHRNIRDYSLSADDFRLEVRFKNGPQNGGISCYDSRFTVMGENSESMVCLMQENCHQFCELKFGKNHYQGKTSDLSFLGKDYTEWSLLVMEVEEKNASVYFNDQKVFEESYKQSSGAIKGLEVRFKGSGLVDYLLLTSPDNDTVYYDGFTGESIQSPV